MIDRCAIIGTDSTPDGVADTAALADLYRPVRHELERTTRIINDELRSSVSRVNDLCAHVETYRGKRIRAALVLLSGGACGNVNDDHCVLAAVVELVHLATLLHDDVLDEAKTRRRQGTINNLHGNESAVLLGDYYISHAYHLCSSLGDQHAARTIGHATNTVCEGELLQVFQRGNPRLTEEEYFQIIERKTAALTGTCSALGARHAGADAKTVTTMRAFGVSVGIAFQIVDDVLDMAGDESRTGKSRGRDLAMGEATLPFIHCLANLSGGDADHLRTLVTGQTTAPESEIQAMLKQTDSVAYAFKAAHGHVDQAISHLAILPESPERDALAAMAEFILRRRF